MAKPQISVIIPLYNAEKFIRECLLTVYSSEFKDYEILVVNDCSTDNSVAEVKKLQPHFDGRLKLFSTKKNSGGAGIPRNVGIKNSVGKYITFIDNDDMILPNALGDFFEAAEKFQADVVYAEKIFTFKENLTDKIFDIMITGREEDLVDEPTLESEDLKVRIQRDIDRKFFILPWGKFYRRDFLVNNKIDFPQMRYSEDVTFCFKCLCLAKNYLRVPFVANIRRHRKESAGHTVSDIRTIIQIWLKIFSTNINILDEFMLKLKFFQNNPDCQLAVLKHYITVHLEIVKKLFLSMPTEITYPLLCEELQSYKINGKGRNIITSCILMEKILEQSKLLSADAATLATVKTARRFL